ncbi:hypothetical protein [Pedobacter sp. MR22-3]|uniref:hypothetical protein n=1 Tax=Pedobacter sp. MR22-3 TaxID=2994552 RepID=UPI00224691E2|nr:hypothetical protein [Pedobacter sp. MR22-3]MCX2585932.1 hypothetical protein [Pedobacter sp. MR22-3]
MKEKFWLLILALFLTKHSSAQSSNRLIDNLMSATKLKIGNEFERVGLSSSIDLTKLEKIDSIPMSGILKLFDYSYAYTSLVKEEIPIDIILVGTANRRIKSLIYILSPVRIETLLSKIGKFTTKIDLPSIGSGTTVLYSWEFPSYSTLLYAGIDGSSQNIIVIYSGKIESIFRN